MCQFRNTETLLLYQHDWKQASCDLELFRLWTSFFITIINQEKQINQVTIQFHTAAETHILNNLNSCFYFYHYSCKKKKNSQNYSEISVKGLCVVSAENIYYWSKEQTDTKIISQRSTSNNTGHSRKKSTLTVQTFTSAGRRMWDPHSGYMGFIQDQSWGCLKGAFTNWKAQQQAAGQWKSLDPLTVHFLLPHRKGTLVEVTVGVWMAKTIMRTAWTGTSEQKSSS